MRKEGRVFSFSYWLLAGVLLSILFYYIFDIEGWYKAILLGFLSSAPIHLFIIWMRKKKQSDALN